MTVHYMHSYLQFSNYRNHFLQLRYIRAHASYIFILRGSSKVCLPFPIRSARGVNKISPFLSFCRRRKACASPIGQAFPSQAYWIALDCTNHFSRTLHGSVVAISSRTICLHCFFSA